MIQDLYDKGVYNFAEYKFSFSFSWDGGFPENIGRIQLYSTTYDLDSKNRSMYMQYEELELGFCSEPVIKSMRDYWDARDV